MSELLKWRFKRSCYAIIGLQALTLILYYFGPVNYIGFNKSLVVVTFVFGFLSCYWLGYKFTGAYYLKGKSGPRNVVKFVRVSGAISLMFSAAVLLQIGSVSWRTISSLGDLYRISHQETGQAGLIIGYIRMWFGYYIFALFPVLLVYGGQLPKRTKYFGYGAVILGVFVSLLQGINRDLFNLLILAVCFKILPRITYRSIRRKSTLAFGAAALIGMAAASTFFTAGQLTRYGSPAVTGMDSRTGMYSKYNVSDGALLVGYSALTSYLTQGYHAFDLALSQPFEFTYGVGNSTFLARQVDRLAGTDIENKAYPARLGAFGWDKGIDWSTFYVWWASDVTFPGLFFLMFFIGSIFRLAENTVNRQADIKSICLYSYLIIMGFYFSANNQIFQSGESTVGFLWVFCSLVIGRHITRPNGRSQRYSLSCI